MSVTKPDEPRPTNPRESKALQYLYEYHTAAIRCIMPMMFLFVTPTISEAWSKKHLLLSFLTAGVLLSVIYEVTPPRVKLLLDMIRYPTVRLRDNMPDKSDAYRIYIAPCKSRQILVLAFAFAWASVVSIPHIAFVLNGDVSWWNMPVGLLIGMMILLSPIFHCFWPVGISIQQKSINIEYGATTLKISRNDPVYFHDAGFGVVILKSGRYRIRISGASKTEEELGSNFAATQNLWRLLLPLCNRVPAPKP